MPEYIQYDERGRIIRKWYSVPPSEVSGLPNILEVPRDVFRSLTKFHKVVDGQIVEMTQEEKEALIQEELEKEKLLEAQRIENLDVSVRDLATALIEVINKRIPDNPITKEELVTQLKKDKGL